MANVTKINATQDAANIIKGLSIDLWNANKTRLQELGYKGPSVKLAVDALLYATETSKSLGEHILTHKSNLYMTMIGKGAKITEKRRKGEKK